MAMKKKSTTKAKKPAGGAKKKAAPAAKVATTAKRTSTAQLNVGNVKPSSKPRTKNEIMNILAEATGLSKKEISTVFQAMADVIGKDIGKRGCGVFTMPGLMKIRVVNRPATKSRKGTNPFTGEEMVFAAKPARNVVRIRPLKALKDMV
jgi:nucleoid DNA-binding protein